MSSDCVLVADTTHPSLRAYVPTDVVPLPSDNMLPSLKWVAGTLTVEPTTDNFNCSRLKAQQRDGRIRNLVCGDDALQSTVPSDIQRSLSSGARAGTGVGVAVFFIAVLVATLMIYRRSRSTRPQLDNGIDASQVKSAADEFHEVPDTHIYELHVPATEMPDNHDDPVHEMWTPSPLSEEVEKRRDHVNRPNAAWR